MAFIQMKFAIRNEAHSIEVQKELFSLGYRWGPSKNRRAIPAGNLIMFTDKPYLYTNGNGVINYGDKPEWFRATGTEEYFLG